MGSTGNKHLTLQITNMKYRSIFGINMRKPQYLASTIYPYFLSLKCSFKWIWLYLNTHGRVSNAYRRVPSANEHQRRILCNRRNAKFGEFRRFKDRGGNANICVCEKLVLMATCMVIESNHIYASELNHYN